MTFEAFAADGTVLSNEAWFSVGGGFVERDGADETGNHILVVPFPFRNGDELLALGAASGLSIRDMALANEAARHGEAEARQAISRIAAAMFACIDRGLSRDGELPGGLKVSRRAKGIHQKLEAARRSNQRAPHETMNYVSAFAIAVNEENAAGGRVVTAPTNGAAGVVPAVLRYYRDFCPDADEAGIETFFLAATAIGGIIKRNASISGAVGRLPGRGRLGGGHGGGRALRCPWRQQCAGRECCRDRDGAPSRHDLRSRRRAGADPLHRTQCLGAIKAINAATLALQGDGIHKVSLDQVVETMRQTGGICSRNIAKPRAAASPSTCRNADHAAGASFAALRPMAASVSAMARGDNGFGRKASAPAARIASGPSHRHARSLRTMRVMRRSGTMLRICRVTATPSAGPSIRSMVIRLNRCVLTASIAASAVAASSTEKRNAPASSASAGGLHSCPRRQGHVAGHRRAPARQRHARQGEPDFGPLRLPVSRAEASARFLRESANKRKADARTGRRTLDAHAPLEQTLDIFFGKA